MNNISAKNYITQARIGLNELSKDFKINKLNEDSSTCKSLSALLPSAIHFVVPDGGSVMDDSLRGIRGECVRLPFPKITIEYHVPDGGKLTNFATVRCSKRVIFAQEILDTKDDSQWIQIISIVYNDAVKKWMPCAIGWLLSSKWDEAEGTMPIKAEYAIPKNAPPIVGKVFPVLIDSLKEAYKILDATTAIQSLMHDLSSEVSVVLELCEALSCSNVSHEPIEKINPNVNARRIRDGKVPFYETRCLVINAPGLESTKSDCGGTHSGPRQHLRRGHIRRLPDKNIWINSCVVAANNPAKIEKNYAIRRAA